MRAGRAPDAARLVAVSKTVGVGAIGDAMDAGLRVFGESRVQEAREKIETLAGRGREWHLIGHLQRNKARAAVGLFDLIHSVDSVALLEAIDRHAREEGKVQRVLLQVKLSTEESKHGASERELREMADAAGGLVNVRVEGLMTIPPFFNDAEGARPFFQRLRELNVPYGYPELSMGMSGDYEVAIEEGATLVRIGTAIFGERDY
jgi:pyridoxal phosphate enzyme (YggS family)